MICPFCYKELDLHEKVKFKEWTIYLCESCPKDKLWQVGFKVVHPDDKYKE